jgi:multidrug efflux pump subunit AcrA (membrane-fusion protein)
MEYPRLVQGQPAKFLAHMTVLATGEPVRVGEFTLVATIEGGRPIEAHLTTPKRDGLYTPDLTPPSAGEYEAKIIIEGSQVSDTIPLGKLVVHADEKSMMAAVNAEKSEEVANRTSFLMEQQWKIKMLFAQAERRTLHERIRVPAEVEAPPYASAIISSPMPGRITPPEGRRLPGLGERVTTGQLLALVESPLLMTAEITERAFDLRLKGLSVDETLAAAQAKLAFAQSEYDRLSKLHKSEIASQRELNEVERDLKVATAEYEAAQEMKRWLEAAPRQYSELSPTTQPGESLYATARRSSLLPLTAPIGGQIVSVEVVNGQTIQDHEELFRILDVKTLWIVAHVMEADLGRISQSGDAIFVSHAYPDRSLDILREGGRLIHRGAVVDPQSRTIAIRYETPNTDGLLSLGLFGDVFLETRRTVDAVTVPESAIVMDGSETIIFVLVDGEEFDRRTVDVGIRDSGWVEVRHGVREGERVASHGAYAIKLSSMSGGFGPGHVH